MSSFLHTRDALADDNDVPADEMIAFGKLDTADLSIMIPTSGRPEFLIEAVQSALAQNFDRPFEIVVVDDNPSSDDHERLLARLPKLASANFRYLRNRRNLGMFQNLNRCINQARGVWLTILHDDDLIDASFAREMFDQLKARPDLDGLVCHKRQVDQRLVAYRQNALKAIVRPMLNLYCYGRGPVRLVTARKLFWGCITGNTVGFICRTEDARELGGFHPEEHPSSDYFFYARFAERFRLGQSRVTLAGIRFADNSLMRREAQLACLRRGYELQLAYAGSVLPHFWRRLTPLLMARQAANTSRLWQSGLTPAELEQAIGLRLPRDRPLLLFAIRAILGGF